uniref:Retrovirus-related Pol polyprotein from transposon TNT 1-94 n=1 Tax=Tanacetum cinerariifolium TaxID=118510 RepID=A0A6L2KYE5_TANCI|nr:retrovirus-related Pol polyprotein from transposon TNT 1-94 [Tanacetum cinerariifolium]
MSGTIPPIPPPSGMSPGNAGSPNRVDTIPNDNTNNTGTNNVTTNLVVAEDLRGSNNFLILEESPTDRRLANHDKRLIISSLLNDVMKSISKCTAAQSMWNDLILAHEGPSDTRDTKIIALRLKFNAFKALEGKNVRIRIFSRQLNSRDQSSLRGIDCENSYFQDSDSDVEENTRSNSEFLADLNVEFQDRALLASQKRFYKRWKYKALKFEVAILTKKIDAMSKRKSEKGLVAESFDWDDKSQSFKDEGVTRVKAFTTIIEDETAVGKANVGAKPVGTSTDVIPLANLTQTSIVSDKTKKVTDKESSVKVINKKDQTKSPSVADPSIVKKGSSKSAKDKQKTWFKHCKHCGFKNNLSKDCYNKPKYFTCQSTKHLTKEQPGHVVVKKTMAKLKAQSYQAPSARKALNIPKPFIPCKYFGFNDHHSDKCEYYLGCDIYDSIAHETADCTKKTAFNNWKPIIANQRSIEPIKK